MNSGQIYQQVAQFLIANHKEVYEGEHQDYRRLILAHDCDIYQHVPVLTQYAQKVETITEMGVRFGWSTRAFLFGQPKSLLSIDKYPWGSIEYAGGNPQPPDYYPNLFRKRYKDTTDFQMKLADTLKLESIDDTDLLFIDTFHHRDVLKEELRKFGNSAQKYIILHDTETFGEVGQDDPSGTFVPFKAKGEIGTGLWYAIRPWLDENTHWQVKEHYTNNNGLTVLERR